MAVPFSEVFSDAQEIINRDPFERAFHSTEQPVGYWGTAPTCIPHAGYLCPLVQLAKWTQCGVKMIILLTDTHALMDNKKTPAPLLAARTKYYKALLVKTLDILGANLDNVEFIIGSNFQTTPEYISKLFAISSITRMKSAAKAADTIVKKRSDPLVSTLLYPMMQAIDKWYLQKHHQVMFEAGGLDQRSVACFSLDHEVCPKPEFYVLTPIIYSLKKGDKMSASDSRGDLGTIRFTDPPELIVKKINKAWCPPCRPGETIVGNPILEMYRSTVFPLLTLHGISSFTVLRHDKYGGPVEYNSFDELLDDYSHNRMSSADLKTALADFLEHTIAPIREFMYEIDDLRTEGWSSATE